MTTHGRSATKTLEHNHTVTKKKKSKILSLLAWVNKCTQISYFDFKGENLWLIRLKAASSKVTQAGVGGEVVHVGVASSSNASSSLFHFPGCGCSGGGGHGRWLSHLIGGAEGGMAELADLPDVFPGHHPSPPETPTYHAFAAGVQAQRRRALCFAAGREDKKECGD